MTRAYESTNGRYLDVGGQQGRNRKRARRCPTDRVELVAGVGDWLHCPACGKTADELAQEVAR